MSTTAPLAHLPDAELVERFRAYVQPRGELTQTAAATALAERGADTVNQGTVSRWMRSDVKGLHAHTRRAIERFLAEHGEGGEQEEVGEAVRSLAGDQQLVNELLRHIDGLVVREAERVTGVGYGTIQRWRSGPLLKCMEAPTYTAARAYLSRVRGGAIAPGPRKSEREHLREILDRESRAAEVRAAEATAAELRARAICDLAAPLPAERGGAVFRRRRLSSYRSFSAPSGDASATAAGADADRTR